MRRRILLGGVLGISLAACGAPSTAPTEVQPATKPPPATKSSAAPTELILATTTSTQDSGLLDVLVPRFESVAPFKVKTIAVGSGAAITLGARGEADVVLSHAPDDEEKFMADGNGSARTLVMHNDFIVVGPADDPARLKNDLTTSQAFRSLAEKGAPFVSRGDKSGTHQLELKLWKSSGADPVGKAWYVETGQGMGATLTVANERRGYTVTDRATYLARKSTLELAIVREREAALLNVYHVMPVNPRKHARVNGAGGRAFADFLVAKDTQELIGKFGVEKYGQALFFGDAGKKLTDL
jgi:tungstate transport system substrate-binding protein